MAQPDSALQRRSDYARDWLLSQIDGSAACCIQMPIYPDEGSARREGARRRIRGLRETAVKVPRQEEPLTFRIVMRQTAAEWSHVNQ